MFENQQRQSHHLLSCNFVAPIGCRTCRRGGTERRLTRARSGTLRLGLLRGRGRNRRYWHSITCGLCGAYGACDCLSLWLTQPGDSSFQPPSQRHHWRRYGGCLDILVAKGKPGNFTCLDAAIAINTYIAMLKPPPSAFEEWLTVKEAADYCGASRQFLEVHRSDNIGPRAHQRGRKFIYRRRDLDEWIKRKMT